MIRRRLHNELTSRLNEVSAVALLGPRQVGKTTLALDVAQQRPSVYLDLESEADRTKLSDPDAYLGRNVDKLVILDEVHRMPNIFAALRGSIDRGRRAGIKTGRFLLLGSGSIELLSQSSESLAGRISYIEMGPLDAIEVASNMQEQLWLRGGFPDSFLAATDTISGQWRRDFIRTYLERDIPQFGLRIAAETLRRFWTMLAHHQSGLFNASEFARALGVDAKTVSSYLDLFVDLLLVRRLEPWHGNVAKRLVKTPRMYVRDSGVVHTLLGLPGYEDVVSHRIAGASWEGFVIENLIAAAPPGTQANFFRTAAGAEVDLLLTIPGAGVWAFEAKRSLAPTLERGFYHACEDLQPTRKIVVYPGTETYPMKGGADVMSLTDAMHALVQLR
jgi:uncharacterized protein